MPHTTIKIKQMSPKEKHKKNDEILCIYVGMYVPGIICIYENQKKNTIAHFQFSCHGKK